MGVGWVSGDSTFHNEPVYLINVQCFMLLGNTFRRLQIVSIGYICIGFWGFASRPPTWDLPYTPLGNEISLTLYAHFTSKPQTSHMLCASNGTENQTDFPTNNFAGRDQGVNSKTVPLIINHL